MLKKPPRARDNKRALQVQVRLDGRDYFINRLGRWDDPVVQARGQAICCGALAGCSTVRIGLDFELLAPIDREL
ncbi:hypothetical protein [Prochlorococcus marinus]|uniref:hypothetical protein n=1 Tax=Prochlorococcus marinus TaxID=1219 RepID=UPI0007B3BF7A|nr:hypothetical protein [Prochlorococcus marinus]KZR77211.1 hypothetical protein PMIT1320_00499 [Prochlorococcus marinus str. MIT 1320]